jgi:hypothetical protein
VGQCARIRIAARGSRRESPATHALVRIGLRMTVMLRRAPCRGGDVRVTLMKAFVGGTTRGEATHRPDARSDASPTTDFLHCVRSAVR